MKNRAKNEVREIRLARFKDLILWKWGHLHTFILTAYRVSGMSEYAFGTEWNKSVSVSGMSRVCIRASIGFLFASYRCNFALIF